ncbi:MAG: class I SAM-dependent methyltransferase [Nitrososphaerota archaeon]|jgi:SAM-dependent methyltransferase|uniref:class I SAM-dependent methyltransferase n=1 Tax=Candidatus Bathycorpusculum sp. TaxID=2994959 RepID=UPI0028286DB9|nr:class I SAM-dependent methyltransferase [Candidatus Termitimicrobium sp.]MDR0493533.1 class I SAM-dependent methyltransferase [Nitrososphaerota archaeon]
MKSKPKTLHQSSQCSRIPVRGSELDRFKFGKIYCKKLYPHASNLILDVACGAKPFPLANVLCDLNVHPVPDRRMNSLVTDGKPFILCDSRYLPFKDKAFDFVTSYYLIEHLDEPWKLFKELKRVSKHGYLQCPSWFSELLYSEDVHKWVILKNKGQLYLQAIDQKRTIIPFNFIFQRLYRLTAWRIIHAILDEKFHLFTVNYCY